MAISVQTSQYEAYGITPMEESLRVKCLSAGLITLAIACAPAAIAQSQAEDPLIQCIGIENDAERLACFDRIVRAQSAATSAAPLDGAEAAEAAAEAEAEAEEETRRFGLPRPSLPAFLRFGSEEGERDQAQTDPAYSVEPETQIIERADDGDVTIVLMTVAEVTEHGYGAQRFRMTNGQVWEATGGRSVRIPRSQGPLQAEIRRGLFGGYTLRVNGRGTAVRVRRIDL